MRFLVTGLVLILVGIGVTEYVRRHPSEASKAAKSGAKKVANAPVAPPTMKALIETAAPPADSAGDAQAFAPTVEALVASGGDAVAGFSPVLRGQVKARELKPAGDGAVLVLEKNGSSALVKVPASGAPVVLTVRTTNVATVIVDGEQVVWAEGGQVKSLPLAGGEVKTHVSFTRALVTSLAARGSKLVVSLVPKDGDPFSSEPNGAVAFVDGDDVTLIATEQIRPREVLFDGKDEAFFVAGYPSGLTRAALDGSFTARIAERADGPVALEPDGITWRYPQASAPELKRGARAGGAVKSIARVDAEWLAVHQGTARYTTTGIAPRLYEGKPDAEPTELASIKGVVKGLAWNGTKTWLLTADDDGVVTLQVQ
ncbi:MAG: hypothetical protein MUC96_14265 [Myxococcaceae bacterium]|jgi:hypothetical protein|nr:hypothetical protein [Myxococcaceae bacterium]